MHMAFDTLEVKPGQPYRSHPSLTRLVTRDNQESNFFKHRIQSKDFGDEHCWATICLEPFCHQAYCWSSHVGGQQLIYLAECPLDCQSKE